MAGRTLKKKIQDSIVSILTRYDAERIAIFGSYARGEAGEKQRYWHPCKVCPAKKPDPACTDRRRDQGGLFT